MNDSQRLLRSGLWVRTQLLQGPSPQLLSNWGLAPTSSGPHLSGPPCTGPLGEWDTLCLSLGFEPASSSTSLLEFFMAPDSFYLCFNPGLSAYSISVQLLFGWSMHTSQESMLVLPFPKAVVFIHHPNMAVGSGLYDSHLFFKGQSALHHLLLNLEFPLGSPIGFPFLWSNLL